MKGRTLRIILLGFAGGGVFAAVLWLIAEQLQRPDFSPPDEPRAWAQAEYREIFSPSPAGPLPSLIESPGPHLEVEREPTKLTIHYPDHDAPKTRDQFERFAADANGEVVLPGGNRIRLEAVGFVRSVDVDWGDNRYKDDHLVNWLDPVTLKPLPAGTTADWPGQHLRKQNPASLLLRVSNSGEAPLRWFPARVYDDRTQCRVAPSSSFDTFAKDSVFTLELLIWHQAPLRIAVNFAFGEPEVRTLTLERDAEVRFGDDALVRLIDIIPRRSGSSFWGVGNGGMKKVEYGFSAAAAEKKERALAFHLWPPHNHDLIDVMATAEDGKTRANAMWGDSGFYCQNQEGKFSNVDSVRVRRFPRLGRVVYELPGIPGLPEVTDLFDAPIPEATCHYANELRDLIATGAGVQWQAWQNQNLPETAFPMTLENSSPREALETWERLIGKPLYFDADTLSIRDERPGRSSGTMTGIRKWWSRVKPRWFP